MTFVVLPRLYGALWPLLRALGIVAISIGVGLFAFMLRGALWPRSSTDEVAAMIAGSVTFLLSGMVAALLACAMWELQNCAFVWNTPRLGRRVYRELCLAGLLVVSVAAVCDVLGVSGSQSSHWSLVSIAALGYAVGITVNTSALMWKRLGGSLGIVAGVVPVIFMPEMLTLAGKAGVLNLLMAFAILAITMWRLRRLFERRDADSRLGRSIGLDARWSSGHEQARRATTGDAPSSLLRVRQGDWDWVQATLFERYGADRGGLLGCALRFGLATAILTVVVRLFLHLLGQLRSGAPVAEGESLGFSIAWLTKSFASRQEELIATNLVAAIVGTLLWNRMTATTTIAHPLARPRRAWIVWVTSQVEEVAALGGVFAGFVAMALIVSVVADSDPWPNVLRFSLSTAAVFALLPIARCMRLWWMESTSPSPVRDPNTEAQDPRAVLVFALSMAMMVGGAILMVRVWSEMREALETRLPTTSVLWLSLALLLVVGALRWAWLCTLQRYFGRCDLGR